MNCSSAEKNINSFFKGTLKGNELRKTYYHLAECRECKEVLLDEFSFYTTLNDLDKDLDFNYERKLSELMNKTKNDIEGKDTSLKARYLTFSIVICVAFIALLILAVKVMY